MFGSKKRGAEHVGEGNDSPGSEFIIKDFDGNVDKLKGINMIMRDIFAQDLSTPAAAPPPPPEKKGGKGKKGDYDKASSEWTVRHNASGKEPLMPS